MVGIIQEQHPDRCRLFMQWKGMDFPIMVDSLDQLGVSAVPLVYLIDEAGVVRAARARRSDYEAFMAADPATGGAEPQAAAAPDLDALSRWADAGTPEAMLRYADALVMWSERGDLDRAIDLYGRVVKARPDWGAAHFHLGVALRRRFDSQNRRADDFARAIAAWDRALSIDPNQYIWRRRIQQFGPRLDKPYPFYDWVGSAREQITARGQVPAPIAVEPRGAELTHPARSIAQSPDSVQPPDPDARIDRDSGELIRIDPVTVPATGRDRRAWRVHLLLTPTAHGHWNNEVGPGQIWIDPPQGAVVDRRLIELPGAAEAVSREVREAEFEIRLPDAADKPARVNGYVLYYVCEEADGTCLYRRQDFSVRLGE